VCFATSEKIKEQECIGSYFVDSFMCRHFDMRLEDTKYRLRRAAEFNCPLEFADGEPVIDPLNGTTGFAHDPTTIC
jgi:hypothetical protein